MKTNLCKIENCGKSAHWRDGGKREMCSLHYRRWQRHGDPLICKYADDGNGCVSKGYRILVINGRRVYEHRHVMEQHLSRLLLRSEVVHHKNENPLDNRIDNLEIMTQNRHASLHARTADIPTVNCDHCGNPFQTTHYQLRKNKFNYCQPACASAERKVGGKSHIKKYPKAELRRTLN